MIEVDVSDLLDKPAASRRLDRSEVVPGLKLELAEVPEGDPVQLELLAEAVSEGRLLVSGTLSAPVSLSCARCLTRFEGDVQVRVRESFVPTPADDEYGLVEPGTIDLEPMVRDAILPAMPFAPLCRPDCKGLCEQCGRNRNEEECPHSAESIDPRWAVLSEVAEILDSQENDEEHGTGG